MKSRFKFWAAIGLTLCFWHPASVLADTDPQASQNTQPDQSTVNPQATEQANQDNNKQQDNPQTAQVTTQQTTQNAEHKQADQQNNSQNSGQIQQNNSQNNNTQNNQQNNSQNNNQNSQQSNNQNNGKNTQPQQIPDGWKNESGKRYYYRKQKKLTGWQVLNGHKYYFAADGHMLKGVQKVGKSSYLLSKSGKLQTGLKKYGRYWYFGNKQGKLQTGLKKVKKSTYNYFSPKTFRKYFKNINTKKAYYWVSKKSGKVTGIRLNAAPIGQRPLVTGCEIVAATMMINYAGKKVNKYQAAAATPRSSNPNLGFIGNPYSWSGTWIAPSGLARLVQKYLGRYKIMTGASLSALKKQIFSGHPVVTWVSWVDNFPNHALLLTGYNKSRIYYNDPWTGKKSSMSSSNFWNHYARLTWLGGNHRALSY